MDGVCSWRRRRPEVLRSSGLKLNEEHFTDGDDEILESLVKTATKASGPRAAPRERKRTRHADRKSRELHIVFNCFITHVMSDMTHSEVSFSRILWCLVHLFLICYHKVEEAIFYCYSNI